MRATALHVGVNVSNTTPRMRAPIFWNGRFKFIPFVDKNCRSCPTYEDLGLADYVPSWCVDSTVHYDPEFKTFTYGDYSNIRTHCLRQLNKGDFLFFLSSLQYCLTHDKKRRPWIHPTWAFYIIGYFEIEEIYYDFELKDSKKLAKVKNNAHVRREYDKDFIVWKGSQNSKLLRAAVPISSRQAPTSEAQRIFNTSGGPRWWQKELISEDSLEELWDLIARFNTL